MNKNLGKSSIKKHKVMSGILKILAKICPIKKARHYLKILADQQKRIAEYRIMLRDCNVGEHTYISGYKRPRKEYVTIGKYCSIAREVKLGLGNHPSHLLSTHPFVYYNSEFVPFFVDIKAPDDRIIKIETFKKINIGNDVWIGSRAIIMDGVNIGDGAIIGANAVVTKDIPPYAIAVGSPARVVKYRFEPQIIQELLEIKWWDFPEDFIVNNLPFDNIEKCIEILQNNIHLRKD